MKAVRLFFLLLLIGLQLNAQYDLRVSVRRAADSTVLPGAAATLLPLNSTAAADSAGIVRFAGLPAGRYLVRISHIGFFNKTASITLPVDKDVMPTVLLEDNLAEDEVIVTTTRISRTIADMATRVETISGEELSEKGNMKPGDIRMLLNESTGIQTQQTSATSYNSSIRIQGLDGRYTQVLRDGFPLYGGFSAGLSLMQVAPLDLKQIEVIKGSSSTLYGGGAIAGLVNLVSKTPVEKQELNWLINGTSAGGLDISGFYSRRSGKAGLTFYSSRNTGRAYDPAGIGLSAIPQFERYTANPRLFLYGTRTNINAGFSFVAENRVGGDMGYINNGTPGYFEKNKSSRLTVTVQLAQQINDHSTLNLKSSYTRFNRTIEVPAYVFDGLQHAGFSEASFQTHYSKTEWVAGVNVITDNFSETGQSSTLLRNYRNQTTGVFFQHSWSAAPDFSLESGLRVDHTRQYGWEWLPRLSAMLKLSAATTARLGAGFGYKIPSVFSEAAEQLQFQRVLPVNESINRNERSFGLNADLNYRTSIGPIKCSINQLFFYTRLNRPLILIAASGGNYQFVNANGYIDTRGAETNLRLALRDVKLFVGYTYADVNTHFNGIKSLLPLTARHRLNNVLVFEKESSFKIGVEGYYFSPQQLTDGSTGRDYWIFGLMAEKTWHRCSLFINFENLTDTRQSRFETIYSGSISNPQFRDIYAPLDGFIMNGGIKLRL